MIMMIKGAQCCVSSGVLLATHIPEEIRNWTKLHSSQDEAAPPTVHKEEWAFIRWQNLRLCC